MFEQINNFITWFDGVVWGLPLIHSNPDHRISINSSIRAIASTTSWKSLKIHGEK